MTRAIGATILIAVFASATMLAQAPSPSKPRHCSVQKPDGTLTAPYPESLRGSGVEGTVLLRAVIGENGCTVDVTVVKKLNSQLDKIARETVQSWKFPPWTKDGKPVTVAVQIEVAFKDPGH